MAAVFVLLMVRVPAKVIQVEMVQMAREPVPTWEPEQGHVLYLLLVPLLSPYPLLSVLLRCVAETRYP